MEHQAVTPLKPGAMPPWMWVTATIVAAIVIAGYISMFVYTRGEAIELIKRVDRIEERSDKDIREIRNQLKEILERLPRRK